MPWLALLTNRWTWVALAFASLTVYAAVQTWRLAMCKAEFAQFRADVESEAAKAKVRAAQEAASQALHAQEALDDLTQRHAALSLRYAGLRASPGSSPMPAVPRAAGQPVSSPGNALQPDPDARCLAALEWGDRELAKYAELWRFEKANAAKSP